MIDWVRDHAWELGLLSLGTLVLGLTLIPWFVARLPADYFVTEPAGRGAHPARWVLRNILGWLLIVAGIAMLVLPGQGILTILVGLSLVDFPYKRAVELLLVKRRPVRAAFQWFRRRAKKPPFRF